MLQFAFSLMAVRSFSVALVASAERCCDAGWSRTPDRGRCVQVSSQAMMWDQALATCQGMQGSLVSIRNAFENNFVWNLTSHMPNVTFGAWIGGHTNTPMAQQRTGWTWTNGERWNYAYWQDGKPDNWQGCHGLGFPDDNQQCLEMWIWHGGDPDSAHITNWNDQCCHRPLNFICEKHTVEKPTC